MQDGKDSQGRWIIPGGSILSMQKKAREITGYLKDSLCHGQGSWTMQCRLILSTENKIRQILEGGVLKDVDTQFVPWSSIQRKYEYGESVTMQDLFGIPSRSSGRAHQERMRDENAVSMKLFRWQRNG
jgi:hypothetical protein